MNCQEWDCVNLGVIKIEFVNGIRYFCKEHAEQVLERCKLLKTMSEKENQSGAFSLSDTILQLAEQFGNPASDPPIRMLLEEIQRAHQRSHMDYQAEIDEYNCLYQNQPVSRIIVSWADFVQYLAEKYESAGHLSFKKERLKKLVSLLSELDRKGGHQVQLTYSTHKGFHFDDDQQWLDQLENHLNAF